MTYIETKLTAAKKLAIATQTVPNAIPEGHVRLRLAAGSLCGTDLHYYSRFANASFTLKTPVTLGHEACARVIDPNGSELETGQLVALNPIMNCGDCAPCKRGEENLCAAKKFPGSATTVPHLDGFFRDIIDHPARCCRPAAEGVNPRHLTFAEPLACALHALNKGAVTAGQEVLVIGCGPMGLLAVVGAVARGAGVTAIDLRPEATKVALKTGAGEGLAIGEFDETMLEKRFDVVVEASGSISAFNTALKATRPQGRVAILSNIQIAASETMLHLIMLKELEIVGSFQFNREFEEAISLIESCAVDFNVLTAGTFPLAETDDALAHQASGKAIGKIVILGTHEE